MRTRPLSPQQKKLHNDRQNSMIKKGGFFQESSLGFLRLLELLDGAPSGDVGQRHARVDAKLQDGDRTRPKPEDADEGVGQVGSNRRRRCRQHQLTLDKFWTPFLREDDL